MSLKARLKRLMSKLRFNATDFAQQKKASQTILAKINQVDVQSHNIEKRIIAGTDAVADIAARNVANHTALMDQFGQAATTRDTQLMAAKTIAGAQTDKLNAVLKKLEQLDGVVANLPSQDQAAQNQAALEQVQSKLAALQKAVNGKQYIKQDYFELTSDLGVFTVPKFRAYFKKYAKSLPNKMDALKADTDEGSHQAVDVFVDRIQHYLPEKLPNDEPILFRMDALFTDEEIYPYKSGETARKTREFRKKYDIGTLKTFLCPIFYESGLYYLDDTVKATLKDSIVIDCGAYWGDTAIVFAEYAPERVYAFEPVDYWHDIMTEVLTKNNLMDVIEPVKLGVSDEIGHMFYDEQDTTSNLTDTDTGHGCDVTTIDTFMSDKEGRVGLIKYDVEGMDFHALKGSLDIIKRDKPILLTSIYHDPEHLFKIKPYIDGLGLGYKHTIRKLAKSPLCDLMLISWVE